MCESPESVTLCQIWGFFVIVGNLVAMIVHVIIGIPFRFLRHGLPDVKAR